MTVEKAWLWDIRARSLATCKYIIHELGGMRELQEELDSWEITELVEMACVLEGVHCVVLRISLRIPTSQSQARIVELPVCRRSRPRYLNLILAGMVNLCNDSDRYRQKMLGHSILVLTVNDFHINELPMQIPKPVIARLQYIKHLQSQEEVDSWHKFCAAQTKPAIKNWNLRKLANPWILPSINKFLSKISADNWDIARDGYFKFAFPNFVLSISAHPEHGSSRL
ncbi:hypothetical protein B0H13DRAFT_1884459 [Mycena leptocephala]|nr:hypothetical protein B0H13DRAFT_1884459 [Mycena leptocephala]